MPGWYYQRGMTWESQGSPSGEHFVQFKSDAQGSPSNLLQGVALDGRQVRRIRMSASIKLKQDNRTAANGSIPAVTIRYFDEPRALLGTNSLGPYKGNRDWKVESKIFSVPQAAREAIVSVGLFGGFSLTRQ